MASTRRHLRTRRHATRGRSSARGLLAACAFAGAACLSTPPPASAASPEPGSPSAETARLHVLMINGGERPAQNYQSHLLHVRALLALLVRAGVDPGHISILSADGSDPSPDLAVREVQREGDFWLLQGTRLEGMLRPRITYVNSEVPGARLEAATMANVKAWFERASERLRPGDTLLLYVTDHGTKDPAGKGDSRITLWGDKETLAVSELRLLLANLDPGVRVVALMSQCFSGGFAGLMSTRLAGVEPLGNVCGYFSSTADRGASGCYPEDLGDDNVGHSFDFFQALRVAPHFPSAQGAVLAVDRTPDVPVTTAEVYLADLLRRGAKRAGWPLTAYTDTLLREAWRDTAAWESEIRLLDRIGRAFGIVSPRSLAELGDYTARLPEISSQFRAYSKAWETALGRLAQANLARFLAAHQDWARRVDRTAAGRLDTDARHAFTADLLSALVPWTRADRETDARLALLREKSEAGAAAAYRMEVRLAVVLRLRGILSDVAGRVYLARRAEPSERAAYEALRACEDLSLGTGAPQGLTTLAGRPSFPRFAEDMRVADQILPGWAGIRFSPVPRSKRLKLGLAEGAASVLSVFPGSPAEAAGLQPGDIVVGPPGAPFTEPDQMAEWIMLAKIDGPAALEVLRGTERIRVTLVPGAYPERWSVPTAPSRSRKRGMGVPGQRSSWPATGGPRDRSA